jgi:hypothetical protein
MRICRLLFQCALIVAVTVTTSFANEEDKRAPVPSKEAQAETMKLVKEVYGKEWEEAATVAQKKAFAKRLLDKGTDAKDNFTSRYVLLNVAKSVALQAADGDLAFSAVDLIADLFIVDSFEAKMNVLETLKDKAHTATESESIAVLALGLLGQAVAEDKLEAAVDLCKTAANEARLAHSAALMRKAEALLTAHEERLQASTEAKAALDTLAKKPDDSQANLAAGKYLCFYKADWDKGLPMLALGKDPELGPLAQADIAGANTSAQQAKLGDGWWNLAESKEGAIKTQLQRRSGYWYQKSLPGASGLLKEKVTLRLAEIAKLPREEVSVDLPVASSGKSSGKSPKKPHVKPPVTVVKAEWGGGSHWSNVTARVREVLDEGGNVWASCDCLKADPTPGWKKHLKIEYIKNGKKKTVWKDEGGMVDSPDFKR